MQIAKAISTWAKVTTNGIKSKSDVDSFCQSTDVITAWCDRKHQSFIGNAISNFKEAWLNYHRDGGEYQPITLTFNLARDAIRRIELLAKKKHEPKDILSAKDLARITNLQHPTLEAFLRRYRKASPDCFMTTDSRRRNEPKYLYRLADVLPAVKEHFDLSDG